MLIPRRDMCDLLSLASYARFPCNLPVWYIDIGTTAVYTTVGGTAAVTLRFLGLFLLLYVRTHILTMYCGSVWSAFKYEGCVTTATRTDTTAS